MSEIMDITASGSICFFPPDSLPLYGFTQLNNTPSVWFLKPVFLFYLPNRPKSCKKGLITRSTDGPDIRVSRPISNFKTIPCKISMFDTMLDTTRTNWNNFKGKHFLIFNRGTYNTTTEKVELNCEIFPNLCWTLCSNWKSDNWDCTRYISALEYISHY